MIASISDKFEKFVKENNNLSSLFMYSPFQKQSLIPQRFIHSFLFNHHHHVEIEYAPTDVMRPSSPSTMAFQKSPERFRPHCTHMTMTRVYEKGSVCCSCRQPGQFGWLYACTQDIEQVVDVDPVSRSHQAPELLLIELCSLLLIPSDPIQWRAMEACQTS